VVVDCVEDSCVVGDDELELGVPVCGCAAAGEFVVELFGDCAQAAVPTMRHTAVLASSCLFMFELLIEGVNCNSKTTGKPEVRSRRGTSWKPAAFREHSAIPPVDPHRQLQTSNFQRSSA
jgi:hypothetical protein